MAAFHTPFFSLPGTGSALFTAVEPVLKILAVDNEPSVTLSMRYVFSAPQYDVTCVGDGQAALMVLDSASDPYDVIIVDERMPKLTGLELVGKIRERGIQSKLIVVSANLSHETREAYERLNVRLMLPKPFNIDILRKAVDKVKNDT